MKSWIIRIAYSIIIIYAALSAFILLQSLDNAGVMGANRLVQVSGTNPSGSSLDVAAMVKRVATDNSSNIARTIDDIANPGQKRFLYLEIGDEQAPTASWIKDGYPWFSAEAQTEVKPFSALGQTDARGYYAVYGNDQASAELVAGFRELGYEVAGRDYYDQASMARWLAAQPLGLSVIVVALLAALMTAAAVITNAKGYGVQRLQGSSFGKLLLRDAISGLRFLLPLIAVFGIGVVTFLSFYNGLHQFGPYLLIAGSIAAALTAILIIVHTVVLALLQFTSILESIKGKMPTHGTLPMMYVARVPAVIVLLMAIAPAMVAFGQVASYQASQQAWKSAGNAVYVGFNSNIGGEEQNELAAKSGNWLRSLEPSGDMILTHQDKLETLIGGVGGDVLLVNNNYLKSQPVLDANGQRITDTPVNEVTVLIPNSRPDGGADVTQAVTEWTAAVMERFSPGQPVPKVTSTPIRTNQTLFNYGNSNLPNTPVLMRDPVVLVINTESGAIPASDYMAYASQGGVVLKDQSRAISTASAAGITDFIIGYRPAALEAAAQYAELLANTRIHVFNVLASLGALIATGIGVALVYGRRNAQSIFAKFISGWTFIRTHPRILWPEAAMAAIIILFGIWLWNSAMQLQNQATQDGLPLSPDQQLLVDSGQSYWTMAVGLLGFAGFVIALMAVTRNIVRNRSSEA